MTLLAPAGSGGGDDIGGGPDNDVIFRQQGDDMIDGDAGDDVIEGNSGGDTIDGGDDQDDIVGGGSAFDGVRWALLPQARAATGRSAWCRFPT